MSGRTALVTGSAGFIGRNIAAELERRGWQVTRCDLRGHPRRDALDLFRGPPPTTRSIPSRRPYDLAVHCAATIGGRAAIDGAPLRIATNAALDSWFLDWLVRGRARHGVYFSSSAAYPVHLQQPGSARRLAEADLDPWALPAFSPDQGADSTYGQVKVYGETLAELARQHGASVTVLRPFSGYGPDQDADYPYPAFVERARRREDPFVVWGTGEQTRDFIHIRDVVRLTLHAAEWHLSGPYNLCTGRATSFLDLARIVTRAAGYSPQIRTLPDKPTGVHYRVGDPARMLDDLGEPTVTLEQAATLSLAQLVHP